jgi:hypothetical protein
MAMRDSNIGIANADTDPTPCDACALAGSSKAVACRHMF